MKSISCDDYFQECRKLAKTIVEQFGGEMNQAYDMAHEIVGDHRWIVGTFYNLQVLQHSQNADSYFKARGSLAADDYGSAMRALAWEAMHQDVIEELEML